MGIVVMGLAGHCVLPSVRNQMESPDNFPQVFGLSCGLISLIYLTAAASGYASYGAKSAVFITTNMFKFPGPWWTYAMATVVVLKVSCSIPIVISLLAEIPESAMKLDIQKEGRQRLLAFALRSLLYSSACLVAFHAHNFLNILEALIGSVATMSTTFLFPALFYILLFWPRRRLRNAAVVAGGTFLAAVMTWQDFQLRATQKHHNGTTCSHTQARHNCSGV